MSTVDPENPKAEIEPTLDQHARESLESIRELPVMRFPRPLSSLRSQMLVVALVAVELALWLFLHRESYRQIRCLDSWSEGAIQQVFLILLLPIPAFVVFWTIPLRAEMSCRVCRASAKTHRNQRSNLVRLR